MTDDEEVPISSRMSNFFKEKNDAFAVKRKVEDDKRGYSAKELESIQKRVLNENHSWLHCFDSYIEKMCDDAVSPLMIIQRAENLADLRQEVIRRRKIIMSDED